MKNTGKESFRRGFAAGFSAPYKFAYGGRIKIVHQRRDLVSVAWDTVGKVLSNAIHSERESIGKITKPSARATER